MWNDDKVIACHKLIGQKQGRLGTWVRFDGFTRFNRVPSLVTSCYCGIKLVKKAEKGIITQKASLAVGFLKKIYFILNLRHQFFSPCYHLLKVLLVCRYSISVHIFSALFFLFNIYRCIFSVFFLKKFHIRKSLFLITAFIFGS